MKRALRKRAVTYKTKSWFVLVVRKIRVSTWGNNPSLNKGKFISILNDPSKKVQWKTADVWSIKPIKEKE